jgi:hypothetical protein
MQDGPGGFPLDKIEGLVRRLPSGGFESPLGRIENRTACALPPGIKAKANQREVVP